MPPISSAGHWRNFSPGRQCASATFWQGCKRDEAAYAAPMMIYGRPVRNPRLLLVGALFAASLMLPLLGAIA
jgi:hypothetical protein